jgi:NADPH2:quinone reductase
MQAIHCIAYGEPKDLVLAEIPAPVAAAGEVVVAIEAVGLGFVDGLYVRGGYQVKKPLPFIPGSEIAGTVIALGEGAPAALLGRRVMALADRGGLAEEVAIAATRCVPLPDFFGSAAAASSFVNYSTGIYGFENCGALQPGETVLVLGASGGVGMAAIDIAKGLGATVVAAASSADKLAACLARGADFTVDYSTAEWRKALDRTLDGRPVNVVYDPVGSIWSETAFRCLAPGGRHLVVGFAGGEIPRIPLNLPLLKRASIVGVDWGGYVRAEPAAAPPIYQRIIDLVGLGKIQPRPSATFPLKQAPAVLTRILARENIGKPVIVFPTRRPSR